MTQSPKEKADELYLKFLPYCKAGWNAFTGLEKTTMDENATQCALIAVELRLEGHFAFSNIEYGDESLQYWQQVKAELEKK